MVRMERGLTSTFPLLFIPFVTKNSTSKNG
jgi:hypothetical protein